MVIMTTSSDSTPGNAADTSFSDLACPFCALACDDVSLPANRHADTLACPKARDGFALALDHSSATPTIGGVKADWQSALGEARRLLEGANLPVFHGLVGDLGDARAAWAMAARFGGVVDHRDGDTLARSLGVFQDSGWISTSLGELRNRADLVVWVGRPLYAAMPRLRERLLDWPDRLHVEGTPEVLELGEQPLDTLDQARALLRGRPLAAPLAAARALCERLRGARYAVLVIGELDGDLAEPTLRSASGLVRDLNERQRAALLLLGKGPGDITAQLCGAWHNGFGIRTSMARGYPQQDLERFAADRLLAEGQADLLVWISSLAADPPAPSAQPQLVFGHPAMQFAKPPAVYLPVAVPGVQRAGFLHRGDGLRLVPLRSIIDSALPATADLCQRLLDANHAGE